MEVRLNGFINTSELSEDFLTELHSRLGAECMVQGPARVSTPMLDQRKPDRVCAAQSGGRLGAVAAGWLGARPGEPELPDLDPGAAPALRAQ